MKYIVYKTINLNSKINGINRIYIGVHKTENPEIFDGYIGCGVNIYKASSYMYPKTAFQYAVKKYGVNSFKRSILFIYDTAQEAFDKEREIVDNYFIQQSFTYNMACGGSGGDIVDPRKHSLPIYQFDLQGNLLNSWETTVDASDFFGCSCRKITGASVDKYECLGYYWSRTNTINISNYKAKHKKYTYLYNKDGKLIDEFISRSKCAEYLGCTPQAVSKALSLQQPIKNYYVSDSIVDQFIPKPRISLKNSFYYIYDSNNNFYGKLCKKEVLNTLKINTWKKFDSILNSNGGWYKDFYVSAIELKKVPSKKISSKTIEVYTKDGKLIEILNSVKEVKIKYNLNSYAITKILKGNKQHEQYIFKYSK